LWVVNAWKAVIHIMHVIIIRKLFFIMLLFEIENIENKAILKKIINFKEKQLQVFNFFN